MYRFALQTLLADRRKLITAVVGVVFSLVLVNIQGGLYFGLIRKASLLTDNCRADLWVGHRQVENVDFAHDIPEAWLNRVRGLAGVTHAEAYIVGKGIATNMQGGFEDVWVIGSEPRSRAANSWTFVSGSAESLRQEDAVGVDELDFRKLGIEGLGDRLEINGRKAKVAALTHGVQGFMTTPYVLTTLENARRYARIPEGYCSYLLIRLESSADPAQVRQTICQRLPDADVYTSEEFGRLSQDYFLQRTGIGISFGAATLLGVLVGVMMVGQSLYAMALDHINDYATLKAIGASAGDLRAVLGMQALVVAVVGTALGCGLVVLLQSAASTPQAPIARDATLMLGSVALVFLICLLATTLPLVRIRRIDPVTVLQG